MTLARLRLAPQRILPQTGIAPARVRLGQARRRHVVDAARIRVVVMPCGPQRPVQELQTGQERQPEQVRDRGARDRQTRDPALLLDPYERREAAMRPCVELIVTPVRPAAMRQPWTRYPGRQVSA